MHNLRLIDTFEFKRRYDEKKVWHQKRIFCCFFVIGKYLFVHMGEIFYMIMMYNKLGGGDGDL